ncbi:uncharacterized protein FOMMEDRAFT_155780 [Fomitiporia mediterranea MF3/22]|uniref:uncharacterized protein n=1 Tax=Fomitiporia mediterranea (strain MF3/22) TaxID=694068 RepID=UPI0004408602|nr:uncharacterized protein FOMMEDRAFT_155780 [Fomitiporia mediterranea MF3/22]EJD04627.1 hypothetical protein FOMMEDRAFT_155780 [Fomitiporia mediterranea MF3/22]
MTRKNRGYTSASNQQLKPASQHSHTSSQQGREVGGEVELKRCLSVCTNLQAEINNKVSWLNSFDSVHDTLASVQASLPSKDDLNSIISAAKVISQRQREGKNVDKLHDSEFYRFDRSNNLQEVQVSREGEKEELKQRMAEFKRAFNVKETPARGKSGKRQSNQSQIIQAEDLIQRIYISWRNGDYEGFAKLHETIDKIELHLKDILDDRTFWNLTKENVSDITEQHNEVKPYLKKRQVENLPTLKAAEKRLEEIKERAVFIEQQVRSRFWLQLGNLNGVLNAAHIRQ